ncbi:MULTISPECIES: hypothetical protein [unclassified Rhizobium]|uniref:hypothetical protein n=1 Tax=unclassified Rhizobium TaxID=2613769 RepID=UPI002180B48C|nr:MULTISPECIES: hypothetical protein [unclassified Rhizobium]
MAHPQRLERLEGLLVEAAELFIVLGILVEDRADLVDMGQEGREVRLRALVA